MVVAGGDRPDKAACQRCLQALACDPWRALQVCQVSALLTLLSGVLKPLTGGSGGGSGSSQAALAPDHYERLFLYCAAWSLGGLLDVGDRVRFDAKLRTLTDQAPHKVGVWGRGVVAGGSWGAGAGGPASYMRMAQLRCSPCAALNALVQLLHPRCWRGTRCTSSW